MPRYRGLDTPTEIIRPLRVVACEVLTHLTGTLYNYSYDAGHLDVVHSFDELTFWTTD